MTPKLSVVIPTFNNLDVLKRCVGSWQKYAGREPVELLIIEDGCKDGTAEYLEQLCETPWGSKKVRWFHENDVHELRCDNRGFLEARGELCLAWQDDMFLEVPWLVRELLDTFDSYEDIGLLALFRGINCYPPLYPITKWEDLHDERHQQGTIGPGLGLNWLRIAEVDIVVRPWVVRRACLEKVGPLDEAFCPTEWDEADLAYRVRRAGWKVGVYGYERLGAFTHLGSSTLGRTDMEKHKMKVLPNGQLFHARWDETIRAEHPRDRRFWWRRMPPSSLKQLARRSLLLAKKKIERAVERRRAKSTA